GSNDRIVVVHYLGREDPDLPPMQIQLGAYVHTPPFTSLLCYGSSTIVCDLNAAQAEQVIRSGLPDNVAHELNAAADRAGWAASPLAVADAPVTRLSADLFFGQ